MRLNLGGRVAIEADQPQCSMCIRPGGPETSCGVQVHSGDAQDVTAPRMDQLVHVLRDSVSILPSTREIVSATVGH